ncbi:MAG TPA: M1 family metallopeptidase [Steroidobacteraceae bacterium]|nr:M1 family metallopeptidase [Steroidobacteraceae bacterium]
MSDGVERPSRRVQRKFDPSARTALAIAAVLLIAASPPARTQDHGRPPGSEPARNLLPGDVVPLHYDLAIAPDAARMRFTGVVSIDLDVLRATRSIELNAVDLQFEDVRLAGRTDAPRVSFDSARQTATLSFATPIDRGPHVLRIAYAGKINANAAGLFALEYGSGHARRHALYTQFENSDARRFVPCWDEPDRKATFTLTATLPRGEMAVSNMPVRSIESLAQGLERVEFRTSPKMSSYLLFFAAGDFERISRQVNGVELGVVVKRGDTDKARFALDAAAHLLPYYEHYFEVKYPLPKLDLIAAPGESQFFEAMENWGAIFFFEQDLLVDPDSGRGDQRDVYIDIAHEMAHQWFGDLVTMQWWDDLWLNEGFASWMEIKASDHFHPEWHLWLDAQNEKDEAMGIDARRGTHPVIQPIRDVLQANQAFDTITYLKGQAVVRMLESYVGENTFRDGVRAYIKAHAYGNTVSDDLWRALDAVSGLSLIGVAHDFTLQPGVPLIRAQPTTSGIELLQERFAEDDSGRGAASWQVPVVEESLAAPQRWRGIVSRAQPARVPGNATQGVIVNAGQAGYFRSLYAPQLLQALAAQYLHLPARDELGLIDDSYALGTAGYEPLSDFVSLLARAQPEMDPTVLKTCAEKLESLDSLYAGLPAQAQFRAFARAVLRPIFAKLGWTGHAEEDQNDALLRETLLEALSRMDDPDVIASAQRRFLHSLHDPESLAGDLRSSVLGIVAEHADAATWETLHKMARQSASSLEQQFLYRLLGTASDPALARRALAIALTDEAPVTMRPEIIASVAELHPELAFDFTLEHLATVMSAIEPDSRTLFVPQLVSHSSDSALIPRLRAYADAHIPPSARGSAIAAEAEIAFRARIRAQRLPPVSDYGDRTFTRASSSMIAF